MTFPLTVSPRLPRNPHRSSATTVLAALFAIALVLPAFLVALWPEAIELLEYRRSALAQGQWWRLFTGHWTHWDASHLWLDAAAFVLLATACAKRSKVRVLLCLGLSAPAISFILWIVLPQMTHYRGLSGLDAALFALLAGWRWRDAVASRSQIPWAAGLALATLALKILYEVVTGDALFLAQENSGFVPIPWAHAVGGLVGLALSWVSGSPRAKSQSSSGGAATSTSQLPQRPVARSSTTTTTHKAPGGGSITSSRLHQSPVQS